MDLKTCVLSLPCPPPSFLSLNYKCPPTLGSGELWMEGGMQGLHLLFINTGSGNTPHCQPNPLSLHLVPWQRGVGKAAVTRYRAPDVLGMGGCVSGSSPCCSSGCTLMKTGWSECNAIYCRDPCYCSHIVTCLFYLSIFYYNSFLSTPPSLPFFLCLGLFFLFICFSVLFVSLTFS